MNKLLRFMSVLMIIGGSFFIVAGVVAVFGGSANGVSGASNAIGNSWLLITLLCGIAQLIAGIVGLRNADRPYGNANCILWGIAVMALTILSMVVSNHSGRGFSWLNLIVGILVPLLYLVGALRNKDRNEPDRLATDHR